MYDSSTKFCLSIHSGKPSYIGKKIANLSEYEFAAEYLDATLVEGLMVMRRMPGETLDKVMKMRNWTVEERIAISLQVALAIQKVHMGKIVHGDLKPKNICVDPNDNFKCNVIDFGESRRLTEEGKTASSDEVRMTVEYASPEQLRGQALDQKSDMYSFGLVLCEIWNLPHPYIFTLANTGYSREIAKRITEDASLKKLIACFKNETAPEEIVNLIKNNLSFNLHHRFSTMEMIKRLQNLMPVKRNFFFFKKECSSTHPIRQLPIPSPTQCLD
ncbi:MAG: hypothetical protein EPO11_01570 [Gammaproteobacteria bacterium]|nr:MAG: hypothetical protein EPO11_01570 [Gammaproteobacteria bacterium]